MKRTYIATIVSLVIVGTMNISCKTDKENTPADMSETNTVEDNAGTPIGNEYDTSGSETTASSTAEGTTGLNKASATDGSQIESQGQTSGTAVNKAQKIEQSAAKGKKSLKGYGAPDGTDAENHDGDQYTKNDTTRMPSGSIPIK